MNDESLIFFKMVRDFLTLYLPNQKGASKHTIKSYKNTLNQFLDYAVKTLKIKLNDFKFSSTTIQLVEKFLSDGETNLGWSISTRNQKLAAIKSFYKYSSNHDYSLIAYYKELQSIPVKREVKNIDIDYFSEEELKILLEQPDILKRKEFRNFMIMILMYDTGGRIQEILDLTLGDIKLDNPSPYVIIHGKGKKTRLVPIMENTIDHLKSYIKIFHRSNTNSDEVLFYTVHNGLHTKMSQDNVQKILDKYVKKALDIHSDFPEHIYCHMFRHSRAMHLYRNGMPLPLVSEWLGHSQINTTRMYYANANIEMKRTAINKATSELNPLLTSEADYDFNDEVLIKKLYGLQ